MQRKKFQITVSLPDCSGHTVKSIRQKLEAASFDEEDGFTVSIKRLRPVKKKVKPKSEPKAVEIEDFGRSLLVHRLPDRINPYDLLDYCNNVEREGMNTYRFEGVRPADKKKLIKLLKG